MAETKYYGTGRRKSAVARVYVKAGKGKILINGHDDGTLEPGGTTTRAQAASILMNFDQNVAEN